MTSRFRTLAAVALAASVAQAGDRSAPQRVTFDAAMLRGTHGAVDLSAFEQGAAMLPGEHVFDVVRNGIPLGRRRVRFVAEGNASAVACIDRAFAEWIGVALVRLARETQDALRTGACIAAEALHPAARVDHDAGALTLHVSMPQALLQRRDEAADPEAFDAGIPALRVNYAASVVQQDGHLVRGGRNASLHLDAGANAGAWRWRHRGSHAQSDGGRPRSQVLASTLERDVPRFDAQLTLGDFHASGMLFDPVALRGVRFQSDDRMLPIEATRPGPIVRGTADTNARVQVRQAGLLLLEAPVPPGPFALEDVRPLARGGALQVRIVEADGRTRNFELPWSAMPGALRAGRARFGLAAGTWRAHDATGAAPVFQGVLQRGLHDRLTLHGGAQVAPDYAHVLAGAAFAVRAGAFSLDRTRARNATQGERRVGASTRVAFATRFAPTRTQVDIAAWHRANAGHRSLNEAMHARRASPDPRAPRERERIEAAIRQVFGARRHALRLALVGRRFDSHADTHGLQLAYALPPLPGGAQLQGLVEHARDAARAASTQATLSLAVPLQSPSSRTPMLAQAHARAGPGRHTIHAGVGGAFGADARNSWRAGLSNAGTRGTSTVASTSLARNARAGHVAAGWSEGPSHRQWSVSGDGSIVLHAHGLTFGPPLGDTAALVRAEHGAGARLLHVPQGRLDRKGRALVPHLSPYRRNRIGVDPAGTAPGVAFDWTERDVVPRAGALVEAVLPTARAATRFVRILDAAGVPPPFGARIVDDAQATRGHIGGDGLALLDVVPADAPLAVHWRDGDRERHCTLTMPPPGTQATRVDLHGVNVRVIACTEDPHPPEGSPR